MLKQIRYLSAALEIPYCHHEKWDGTGYPRGLKGEQIPISARMFSIVDVYDALSNDRPYRKALPQEEVIQYLEQQSGAHFDPAVVKSFIQILKVT
jgi:HD-GYP domain-containing protein (c-di-GMP phosphodiesterase class II)